MNGLQLLAYKYAYAFVAVVGDGVSTSERQHIANAYEFLRDHASVRFILAMPQLTQQQLEGLLDTFFTKLALPGALKKLCILLAEHKRLFLLSEVLKQIGRVFQKKFNEEPLHITSSHTLSKQELDALTAFFARETKKKIIADHALDSSLIAGIRLQSPTFLWEHSVRKQLHELRLPLIKGHYEY